MTVCLLSYKTVRVPQVGWTQHLRPGEGALEENQPCVAQITHFHLLAKKLGHSAWTALLREAIGRVSSRVMWSSNEEVGLLCFKSFFSVFHFIFLSVCMFLILLPTVT